MVPKVLTISGAVIILAVRARDRSGFLGGSCIDEELRLELHSRDQQCMAKNTAKGSSCMLRGPALGAQQGLQLTTTPSAAWRPNFGNRFSLTSDGHRVSTSTVRTKSYVEGKAGATKSSSAWQSSGLKSPVS